jgi:hypothetical protein
MQANRVLSVLSLMVLPLPAAGQSSADVARSAHLMGTWAMSCEAPHVPNNSRITYYTAPNNQLRRGIDRGAGLPMLDGVVDNIEMISATIAKVRVRNDSASWGTANGRWVEMVLQNSHDDLLILSATAYNGDVLIKDGHWIGSGERVPLMHKCGNPDTSS